MIWAACDTPPPCLEVVGVCRDNGVGALALDPKGVWRIFQTGTGATMMSLARPLDAGPPPPVRHGEVTLEQALHQLQLGDALPDQRQARVITEGLSPYRILRVNGAWSEMCGFHPDEAVGCTFGIIQGSATSKRTLAELSEKLRAGRAAASVLVNYRMNGEPFINFLQVCCVCLAMLLCAGAMPWCVGALAR